jgi:glycosyltransferase involved in cell wall biosynthesis
MNIRKESVKIVILNTSDRTGGAAVAAGRLGKALEQAGIQVDKLVRKDTWLNRFRFYWERLIIFLCNHLNRKNLFAVSIANTGTDLLGHPLVEEADIIHLHWINQGFLSLRDIERLVKQNKPIVWTMHDMWPCTGICHHARDCEKFQTECESCFFLKSKGKDLSTSVFDKKMSLYKDANIADGCPAGQRKVICYGARRFCLFLIRSIRRSTIRWIRVWLVNYWGYLRERGCCYLGR